VEWALVSVLVWAVALALWCSAFRNQLRTDIHLTLAPIEHTAPLFCLGSANHLMVWASVAAWALAWAEVSV
jgi:hypothetical protein